MDPEKIATFWIISGDLKILVPPLLAFQVEVVGKAQVFKKKIMICGVLIRRHCRRSFVQNDGQCRVNEHFGFLLYNLMFLVHRCVWYKTMDNVA